MVSFRHAVRRKLNEQVVTVFDPSGRMFFHERRPRCPVTGREVAPREHDAHLRRGMLMVNEMHSPPDV